MDKIADGTKCQLRSEMLRSYYHNREEKKIRQYEYENFVKLYDSYKCLGGNSFIDKIYEEIKEWEIIS
jgi:predicted PolB exonuclease-like 3'-5' exonuclease